MTTTTKAPARRTDAKLSAKDVCDIILACHTSNVSSLKFNELALEFGNHSKTEPDPVLEVAAKEAGDRVEPDYEPDLEQLMIDDPVAYEKYLTDVANNEGVQA